VPRSTLDDIVRDLSDAGLVEYVDGHWRATPVGGCAYQLSQSYAEQIGSLADAVAVLDGSGITHIDCAMLAGCTVFENDGVLPDEVVMEFLDRLRTADRIRGLVPKALAGHVPAAHEAILDGKPTTTEMVFDPAVYEKVAEMYPEQVQNALDRAHVEHYRGPVSVSYGLWIADDDNAGLVVYTEAGVRGIIVNDTAEALAWATDTYEAVRNDAEQVTEFPN
jgi:predicted transcriptional regulator